MTICRCNWSALRSSIRLYTTWRLPYLCTMCARLVCTFDFYAKRGLVSDWRRDFARSIEWIIHGGSWVGSLFFCFRMIQVAISLHQSVYKNLHTVETNAIVLNAYSQLQSLLEGVYNLDSDGFIGFLLASEYRGSQSFGRQKHAFSALLRFALAFYIIVGRFTTNLGKGTFLIVGSHPSVRQKLREWWEIALRLHCSGS